MREFQKKALLHFRKTFNKFSQAEIAKKLGISQKSWSIYESGKRDIPVHLVDKMKVVGKFKEEWLESGVPLEEIENEMPKTITVGEYKQLKNDTTSTADTPPLKPTRPSSDHRVKGTPKTKPNKTANVQK